MLKTELYQILEEKCINESIALVTSPEGIIISLMLTKEKAIAEVLEETYEEIKQNEPETSVMPIMLGVILDSHEKGRLSENDVINFICHFKQLS